MPESVRVQALLDERSAALARRRAEAAPAVEAKPYLACTSGPECFGLSLAQVASVLPGKPCMSLPNAPLSLRGIVALSGHVVTVIDLSAALGLAPIEAPVESGYLVRLKAREAPIALAVDRVLGIVSLVPASLGAPSSVTRYPSDLGSTEISGYAPPGSGKAVGIDGGIAIVDLPRLLRRFLP